jgi:hypothetical protein
MPELDECASYIKTKIKTIFQHDDSNEKPENEQLPPTPTSTLESDETAPLLNVEDQVVSAASNLGEDKAKMVLSGNDISNTVQKLTCAILLVFLVVFSQVDQFIQGQLQEAILDSLQ